MASTVYNIAKKKYCPDVLAAATVKALLITGTVSINADHDDVAEVLAAMAEANGTGYTAGVGSASRKTVVVTSAVDNANDRATASTAATSWTAVSLAATIKCVLFYVHVSGSDDTLNFPLLAVDDASGLPFTTNGSDISLASSVIRYT